MKFKEKIISNQERLQKIYMRGIESIGGISIWEKLNENGDDERNKE